MNKHKVPLDYFKKYENWAQTFRPHLTPRMLQETPESLGNKYDDDPLLNNVPLHLWRDLAAQFRNYRNLPFNHNETVALLKHVTRHHVLRIPPEFVA